MTAMKRRRRTRVWTIAALTRKASAIASPSRLAAACLPVLQSKCLRCQGDLFSCLHRHAGWGLFKILRSLLLMLTLSSIHASPAMSFRLLFCDSPVRGEYTGLLCLSASLGPSHSVQAAAPANNGFPRPSLFHQQVDR